MTRSNPHAGEPITDSDAAIAAALEDVSIPTLVLSLVHMTGDPSWIRGEIRPQGLFLNEVQGFMSEEAKASVRKQALEVIRRYRDGGCRLPPPPSPALVREMMSWLVMCGRARRVRAHGARGDGVRGARRARAGLERRVCGCARELSGRRDRLRSVGAARGDPALKEAGIPFTILEKNAGVGGTWWENTYPGCRVDVGNHFYCYSFEPSDHWSEFFSQQPELQAYFERVMDRHGVREHVRFETEVVAARWDEARSTATGKRTLQDNGSWLQALTRPNVELVRSVVARIEKDAVIGSDGRRHEVDLIVYATGFQANRFLFPIEIVGRGGAVLSEVWGDRPAAYLGITVPGFPNLFCMYGPGTNLAHGGSLIFHSDCQMRYIGGCLRTLIAGGHRAMEPRQAVHEDYYARTQKELETLVWSHPSIEHSWYKNAEGKIHILSPWRLVDYWAWTKRPDPNDFAIS